jgi:hypothetical protein
VRRDQPQSPLAEESERKRERNIMATNGIVKKSKKDEIFEGDELLNRINIVRHTKLQRRLWRERLQEEAMSGIRRIRGRSMLDLIPS